MAYPNSADFARIYIQTAEGPPVVQTLICGVEGVNINRSVQTSETYRRDCTTPNRPGKRKLRVTGSSWQITGSGSDNVDIYSDIEAVFGVRSVYNIELYKDDDTDAGELMGTYSGTAIMTAHNQAMTDEAPGTIDITLDGEDDLVWTAAA